MPKKDFSTYPQSKGLISISKAAKLLGVSADTLRNWEKSEKLVPVRTPGNARRYTLEQLKPLIKELKAVKSGKQNGMLPISKAASALGVSADTLRNWEKKGLVKAERTEGGARRYKKQDVLKLKDQITVPAAPKKEKAEKTIDENVDEVRPIIGLKDGEDSALILPQTVEKPGKNRLPIVTLAVLFAVFALILGLVFGGLLLNTPLSEELAIKQEFEGKFAEQSTKLASIVSSIENIQKGLVALQQDESKEDEDLAVSAIRLEAGSGIGVSGLRISSTDTLSTIAERGGCDACIEDSDVSDTLTLSSASSLSADALTSGTVASSRISGGYTGITEVGTLTAGTWNGSKIAEAYGGTGQTSYSKGDLLYSSDTNTMAKLPIGNPGQILTVSASGTPEWATSSGGGGTVSADSLNFTELDDTLNLDATTDIALSGFDLTTSGSGNIAFNNTGTFTVTGTSVLNGTIDVNGQFTIGDGGDSGSIDTSDWDIDSSGNLTGIGTILADGNITLLKSDPAIVMNSPNSGDTDFWFGVSEDGGGDDDDLFQIGDGLTPGSNPFVTIRTNGNVGIGTTNPLAKAHIESSTYLINEVLINNGATGNPPAYPNSYSPTFAVRTSLTVDSRPLFFGYETGGNWNAFLNAGACGAFTQMCLNLGNGVNDYTALENNGTTLYVGGGDDGTFTDIHFRNTGNIGIGTTAPQTKVQISGGGLCVGSDANCNTDNNTEGVIYSSSTAMTTYDVAENYPTKDTTIEAAEVVELDPENPIFVKRAASGMSNKLLGVISAQPAVLLGGFNGEQFQQERQVAVALSGRVPVKIGSDSEEIKIGDLLTASSEPGKAKKATNAGFTIGRALESWNPIENKHSVMVFVSSTYADPLTGYSRDFSLNPNGELDLQGKESPVLSIPIDSNPQIKTLAEKIDSDSITEVGTNLKVTGYLEASIRSVQDQLSRIEEDNTRRDKLLAEVSQNNQRLSEAVASTKSNIESLSEAIDGLLSSIAEEATDSAEVEAERLNLSSGDSLLASNSAELVELSPTQSFSDQNLVLQNAAITNQLAVSGPSRLGPIRISGDLSQGETFRITGGNSINVIGYSDKGSNNSCLNSPGTGSIAANCGILYIQNSPLSIAVDFFNGNVIIDKTGNITAQSVTVAEFKVLAGKISGEGEIVTGEKSVTITNPLIAENSRILITPSTRTDYVLAVTEKIAGEGFVVSAAQPVAEAITFDWWLVTEVENNQVD